jgi:hypothetical protein
LTPAQQSAKGQLSSDLNAVGLGSLADWAWNLYLTGAPESEIFLQMRKQPAYMQRFPGMDVLAQRGQAITEAQYIGYQQQITQTLHSYGLPTTYASNDSIGQLLTGNVSAAEFSARAQTEADIVSSSPPEVRAELNRIAGITDGDLTHYFLDPNQALPQLQRKVAAAKIAGQGDITGYGQIGTDEALRLADLGITQGQAQAGFTKLGLQSPLFAGLPGQQDGNIDQATQLGAAFEGNAADQRIIDQRTQQRLAAFAGSNNVLTSSTGVTGLTSPDTQ